MATVETPRKQAESDGQMFFHTDIVKAYELARDYAGKEGRVATMPDLIGAKSLADSQDLIWTRYAQTSSGEFYGKSKGGNPIVVVAHGIDEILNNEQIMKRSLRNLRDNSHIQLTEEEFRKLENGDYAPAEVLDHAVVVGMREYPASVLSYEQAMEEPLLKARLGEGIEVFLAKHREITQEKSANNFVITNDHRYPYVREGDEYTGGLLSITQLNDMRRCGGEPSSVSSKVDVADLSSAGRFIAVLGDGKLVSVYDGLDSVFRDFGNNWEKLLIPSPSVPI